MESDWIKIYETDKLYEADMIQAILEDSQIKAIIVNKQDTLYLIGDIEIYVSTDDSFIARQLIVEYKGE
ncbi:MAG: DUF2007 domain-containing protein [Bacteroidales bacterium]|nr:DUF2007 domain-containing protein [Bacteroidales bacterium]